jgi:hypothetical protein
MIMVLCCGKGARSKQAEAGGEDVATVHGAALIDGECADWPLCGWDGQVCRPTDHRLLILAPK